MVVVYNTSFSLSLHFTFLYTTNSQPLISSNRIPLSNLSLTPSFTLLQPLSNLRFHHFLFSNLSLQFSSMAELADPLGDVITVDCSIYEIYGRFPPYVSRVFLDLAPMEASLIDPVGHKHTVKIDNIGGTYFFTKGWANLLRFYDIDVGATVRCVYVRKDTFEISIRDYKGVEWIYPRIPHLFDGSWLPPRVPDPHFAHDRLVANNNRFACILRKWISFDEYTGDVFKISKAWADKYLVPPGNEIHIVDEFGNRWPCQLCEGEGVESDAVLVTTGWSLFCRLKGLRKGQGVGFGVTRESSRHLFFIQPN